MVALEDIDGIHGVGESLSAGVKVHSLAPGIKKTRAPRCVYGRKDSADSELHVMTFKYNVEGWYVVELPTLLTPC